MPKSPLRMGSGKGSEKLREYAAKGKIGKLAKRLPGFKFHILDRTFPNYFNERLTKLKNSTQSLRTGSTMKRNQVLAIKMALKGFRGR